MRRVPGSIFFIVIVFSVLAVPVRGALAAAALPADRLLDRPEGPDVRSALEKLLEGASTSAPPAEWLQESHVRAAYSGRGFSPVFLGSREGFESASRLMESLDRCERHGFDAGHFRIAAIRAAVESVPAPTRGLFSKMNHQVSGPALAGALARVDALLVDRYLEYAFELVGVSVAEEVEARALRESVVAGLDREIVPDPESLAPDHPQYRALQACLKTYRRVAEGGGWPTIDEGRTVRPGERGERVSQIRARLDEEERLVSGRGPGAEVPVPSAEAGLFDGALVERVKAFQTRHALDQDGAVGKMTLRALNVPAVERVRQIEITMARWRRGPRDNPSYRVEANIPGMQAFLYREGRPVLALKTVVGSGKKTATWKGKESRAETPELEDEIETIVVNPRWYVPESIVRTELKASDEKKPGFLDRGGYEWYDSKTGETGPASEVPDSVWTDAASNLKIRQRPGAANALGKLKFLFQNKFAVYMHDTPEKKLFARGRRNYSHGCVRVENPAQLAESLLAYSQTKPKRPLKRLMAGTDREMITLTPPVPIHLLYRTVWVQEDGRVDFLPDIYGWDEAIGDLLPLSAQLQGDIRPGEGLSKQGEDDEAADPVSP